MLTVLSSIVGNEELLQHNPFSVRLEVPAEITMPLQDAETGVTIVTSAVLTSGKMTFSFLQPTPIIRISQIISKK